MPTITIENVSSALYRQLEQAALEHHRSIDREVVFYLERSVFAPKVHPQDVLAGAKRWRQKTAQTMLSEEEISTAKIEGRE